jgi:Ca2+-binding EF-hand superfamily protein
MITNDCIHLYYARFFLTEQLNLDLTPNEITAAIGLIDEDGNGTIEFKEFELWYNAHTDNLV